MIHVFKLTAIMIITFFFSKDNKGLELSTKWHSY